MTEWSKHVHRFAKKHKMSYKQANVSKKCKEAYKKRKLLLEGRVLERKLLLKRKEEQE